MNKVTTINLNGKAYQIEDDGYQSLSQYLFQAKTSLENNPDKEEIILDLEQAIAEKCNTYLTIHKNVITTKEIAIIIKEMGPVDDGHTAEQGFETNEKPASRPKRLYRSTDDAVIGGVASGLGYYFGIDPVVIRIIFLVSVLLGGAGIIIYIILWLAVPEAETTTEKIEMKGNQVTFSSLSERIKEKVEEIKSRNEKWDMSPARKTLHTFFEGIGFFLKKILFPGIRLIVGIVFSSIGMITLITSTIVLGVLLFNVPLGDWSTNTLFPASSFVFYLTIASIYLVIAIPFIGILSAGISTLSKKSFFPKGLKVSLFVLWWLALIGATIGGSKLAFYAKDQIIMMRNTPEETQVVPVTSFKTIHVQNGKMLTLIPSDTFSVALKGKTVAIDNTDVFVKDDILIIKNKEHYPFCIFCFNGKIEAIVSLPALDELVLENASSATGTIPKNQKFSLSLKNASGAELQIDTTRLDINAQNSSKFSLKGNTDMLSGKMSNASSFDGIDMVAQSMTLTLENASKATVHALKNLTVIARNGSTLWYLGNPDIDETLENGSAIRQK